MGQMITIEGLTKRFGSLTAVDNISLSMERGEVLGFWALTVLVNPPP